MPKTSNLITAHSLVFPERLHADNVMFSEKIFEKIWRAIDIKDPH